MTTENYHVPIMLKEVLGYFDIKSGKKFIDCNLGDGGHTVEILKRGGQVLGLDFSEFSILRAQRRIEAELGSQNGFVAVCSNFKNIREVAQQNGFDQVDGILYDLGVSSSQLEESEMGLSFHKDHPLDMRMDKTLGVSAADLVNSLPQKELEHLFRELGEERLAAGFANAILEFRKLKKIQSTKELADICRKFSPGYENGRIHPATRVFQALRIAVNNELDNLKTSLPYAAQLLKPGGRMLVISFHSLEDRIVKEFGRAEQQRLTALVKKPLQPSQSEVTENSRSRSAKMRVFERKIDF